MVVGDETHGVTPFGNPRLRQHAADRGLSQRCHVLHRPSTPRHPPCAHTSLFQRRPGLRPAARAHAGGERYADRKLATTLSSACAPARRGQEPREDDSRYADNEPKPVIGKNMMSTKTYGVGKVHRRAAPRGGATGPVNHRSAPVSAGADRGSLGRLWKLKVQDKATKEARTLFKPRACAIWLFQ